MHCLVYIFQAYIKNVLSIGTCTYIIQMAPLQFENLAPDMVYVFNNAIISAKKITSLLFFHFTLRGSS